MNGLNDSQLADYAKSLDDDCLKYGIIDLAHEVKAKVWSDKDRAAEAVRALRIFKSEKKNRK